MHVCERETEIESMCVLAGVHPRVRVCFDRVCFDACVFH